MCDVCDMCGLHGRYLWFVCVVLCVRYMFLAYIIEVTCMVAMFCVIYCIALCVFACLVSMIGE